MTLLRGGRALLVGLSVAGCGALEQAEQQAAVTSAGGGSDSTSGASVTGAAPTGDDDSGVSTQAATAAVDGTTGGATTMAGSSDDGTTAAGATESGSDAPTSSPYAGPYEGTFTVMCAGVPALMGTLELTVDEAGAVSGSATSQMFGIGVIDGDVDAMGAVFGNADVGVDSCVYAGTIDNAGIGTGALSCMVTGCTGMWDASAV